MGGLKKRKITNFFLSVSATDHTRTTDEAQQSRPVAAAAETEAQPDVRNEATASSNPFDNFNTTKLTDATNDKSVPALEGALPMSAYDVGDVMAGNVRIRSLLGDDEIKYLNEHHRPQNLIPCVFTR